MGVSLVPLYLRTTAAVIWQALRWVLVASDQTVSVGLQGYGRTDVFYRYSERPGDHASDAV